MFRNVIEGVSQSISLPDVSPFGSDLIHLITGHECNHLPVLIKEELKHQALEIYNKFYLHNL